jgi:hypothetical protein
VGKLPPERAGVAARDAWFERASFALMASVHDYCADPESPEIVSSHMTTVLKAIEDRLDPDQGVASTFLGCKALLTVLASADLAGIAPDPDRTIAAAARFAVLHEDSGDPLKLSTRNNHILVKALVLGLLALRTDDATGWTRARGLYAGYLASLNEDGIPEQEAVRGASAAWYCNLAVMLLVRFQSLAVCHEGEIVADEAERVISAVNALSRIVADPAQLYLWSRRNMYPHPNHGSDPFAIDLGFTRGFHRSRYYLAWIPLFEALHGSKTLPPILAGLTLSGSDYLPKCSEFIGGFVDLMVE